MTVQDFLARARRAALEANRAEAFDRLFRRYSESYGIRGSAMLALDDLELIERTAQLSSPSQI